MDNTIAIATVSAVLTMACIYLAQWLIRVFRSRLSLLLSRLLAAGIAAGFIMLVFILLRAVVFPKESWGYMIGPIVVGFISGFMGIRFN